MPRPAQCPDPLCLLDVPNPSACDDCPHVPAAHPGSGGSRRGAGAPRGNLNALRHGRRSLQFNAAVERLSFDPELRPLRDFLVRFSERQKQLERS